MTLLLVKLLIHTQPGCNMVKNGRKPTTVSTFESKNRQMYSFVVKIGRYILAFFVLDRLIF